MSFTLFSLPFLSLQPFLSRLFSFSELVRWVGGEICKPNANKCLFLVRLAETKRFERTYFSRKENIAAYLHSRKARNMFRGPFLCRRRPRACTSEYGYDIRSMIELANSHTLFCSAIAKTSWLRYSKVPLFQKRDSGGPPGGLKCRNTPAACHCGKLRLPHQRPAA